MDNVDFFIKRGDRSPNLFAILKDKNEAAVDLTGKAVRLKMRSFQTGVLVVDSAAVVAVGAGGSVSYAWDADDTGEAGYYYAEWEVTLAAGIVQTFPTIGWHLIAIMEDLDSPLVNADDFLNVQRLRRFIAETNSGTYSDALLHAMMLTNDGDLNVTAAEVWREKAASVSSLVDISESGSSRKMSQLYDRYTAQAKVYEDAAGVLPPNTSARPRTRPIIRADA